jgi:DNA-binding transcriptional MerR regulator
VLIGDVARRSGVSARMLRHYETLGLVRPTGRTVGGYREYSAEDVRRIFHVESLRSLGLSLKQIGRALEDPEFTPSELVGDLIRWTEDRLARERELLGRLRAIDAADPGGWPDVLRVVELMRGLGSADAARRQQAVLAAPSEDGPAPAELLAEAALTEADPNVAGALRWALARSGADAVTALATGLDAPDPGTRRRAVQALAEMPDAPDVSALLTTALDDPDPAVRQAAALTLGGRGVIEAVPVLVAMIVDGVGDVDAAEALGALARDTGRDPGRTDRITALLTAELAGPGTPPPARLRLTQALLELPAPAARGALRTLTEDDDRTVAAAATAFLTAVAED